MDEARLGQEREGHAQSLGRRRTRRWVLEVQCGFVTPDDHDGCFGLVEICVARCIEKRDALCYKIIRHP
ncbi:hypothetical protein Y023_5132 [Burkholderia pseudomallei A79D]|nr:hypothetical protein Y023_5132 [Burkholderia pseudomallei A79D]KGX97326.1 hypothetical protein X997_4815 [Burkholderia pseudomallei A79C]